VITKTGVRSRGKHANRGRLSNDIRKAFVERTPVLNEREIPKYRTDDFRFVRFRAGGNALYCFR